MKLFGLEIRKAADVSSRAQITDINPQGPMTTAFSGYRFRKVSGDFYECLREGIPMIDAAIRRLVSLNGTIRIFGDNAAIVKDLEDFCLFVPVNDTQKGIQAFLENACNETFEQGFSVSEFVVSKDMKDISGLRVADSKQIIYKRAESGASEPWYVYPTTSIQTYTLPGSLIEKIINAAYSSGYISINGWSAVRLDMANKLYFSINNENSDPYGASIMRSMEFASQILVTLQNSMKNVGERFGDPMYHLHMKGSQSRQQDPQAVQEQLQTNFNAVVNAKRRGGSADLVTVGGPDSEVTVKVIGHDGQILQYDIPLRHVLEQLVSKTGLPAWMLGLYWNSTGIKGSVEVEGILQDAKIRQFAMLPEFIRLFSTYLLLRGHKWKTISTDPNKPADWGIYFETPNIRDEVARAQARFLNAQADMMQSGVTGAAPQTSMTLGSASMEIEGMKFPALSVIPAQAGIHPKKDSGPIPDKAGTRAGMTGKGELCGCKTHDGLKELSRPIPWFELDKVEADYEAELKYDWNELKEKVLTILKLIKQKDSGPIPHKAGTSAGMTKEHKGIPDIESFTFSDDQRRAILKELEKYLGYYDWTDTDSAVRWSYAQAYSLGLIQAVKLIGKDRPILDIIKNRETFDELVKSGFDLVKDNATKAIIEEMIPVMEAHVVAGSNPLTVAAALEKEFGDQNSSWERLARSEMSMAAEKAKLDEWKEWDIKMVEFSPAPDACPICFAVAGDYEIGRSPIPVRDTHPRCRCSIIPAESEA